MAKSIISKIVVKDQEDELPVMEIQDYIEGDEVKAEDSKSSSFTGVADQADDSVVVKIATADGPTAAADYPVSVSEDVIPEAPTTLPAPRKTFMRMVQMLVSKILHKCTEPFKAAFSKVLPQKRRSSFEDSDSYDEKSKRQQEVCAQNNKNNTAGLVALTNVSSSTVTEAAAQALSQTRKPS
ncbi:hypothetical protein BX600DRAFT_515382 [Xylariales sp. PMI_506]|nr:hypothetical protein BX600DRAFT_515382 [Xylariales sp. PMI_506]